MSGGQVYWVLYALLLVFRILGTRKRLLLPKMRGEDYFFNFHVGPSFYSGTGAPILAAYRKWMLLTFAPDLAVLPWIAYTGNTRYLPHLMFGSIGLGIALYMRGATQAVRAAKPFALDLPAPVKRIAFSLTPRRASDYTNRKLEAGLAIAMLACIGIWGWSYAAEQPTPNFLDFFRVPLVLLYFQLGAWLSKRAIVAWRAPAPADDAESYLAWREAMRRRYLFICDAARVVWMATLALLSALLLAPVDWDGDRWRAAALIVTLGVAVGWAVWYNRHAKSVVSAALSRKPVTFPMAPETANAGAVCFRPETPLSFIRTSRGYTVNLGSRRIQWAAAWVVGLVLLVKI